MLGLAYIPLFTMVYYLYNYENIPWCIEINFL